ncbi:MAG: hypothetical protein U9Q07_09315 [Planctomycetota bacterium]|nr:hypothetical protein [Planctomycetota bacterium]
MTDKVRSCWWNCYAPDDKSFLDDELRAIDAMEDAIAPLDDQTTAIRQLITRFELCYREADKEAERIVNAISTGVCPVESNERSPERQRELDNCHRVLSLWCENASVENMDLDVGGVSADDLVGFIGRPNPLKIWQVQRIVERIGEALDPNRPYHRMALDVGEHYKDNADFLERTRGTVMQDKVDGRKSRISLAMAVDLLMPCHWDFAGALVAILKAIGGNLQPVRPFACCARNVKLSPLCDRVKIISNTLGTFWKDENRAEDIDRDLLAILGTPTPAKRWLAASLDKTIRLHLSLPFDMNLS